MQLHSVAEQPGVHAVLNTAFTEGPLAQSTAPRSMMLSSSRRFGTRQSSWPAKLLPLSWSIFVLVAAFQSAAKSTSCTPSASSSFSHISPVTRSVTVPSPLSAYWRGMPAWKKASWPGAPPGHP